MKLQKKIANYKKSGKNIYILWYISVDTSLFCLLFFTDVFLITNTKQGRSVILTGKNIFYRIFLVFQLPEKFPSNDRKK